MITGMPRGGTTWFAELLNTIPNSLYLHEPLKKGRISDFQQISFDWHQLIPDNASWPEAEELFQKLFKGQIINPALIERTSNLNQLLSTSSLVIKFVRLNRMLPWVVNKFSDINPPVYIIRHPCAVVYSQMNHGAWDYAYQLKYPYYPEIPQCRFSEFYDRIFDRIGQINSIEQHLALSWCLDTLPIFHEYNNKKWITVSYEKAVLDKQESIKGLFNRLRIEAPDKTWRKLNAPSSSTQRINPLKLSGIEQISKWKYKMTAKQLRDIEDILNKFEIDFYNVDDPEPNYEKLLRPNKNLLFEQAFRDV